MPALAIHPSFPRYRSHDPSVPVRIVTPQTPGCFHRFFDTSPISPSGRYLAALQMPDESRLNTPGEEASVILVDLQTGAERVVASTRGWEPQMGANLNWGADDHSLVFNDVDISDWSPRLVRLNPLSGRSDSVPGGVYHVSPDGRFAAACSLERMRRTQIGYGVVLPDERVPLNDGAPDDDGLFITDLSTGTRRLVLSLAQAAQAIPELAGSDLSRWHVFGFHCKWSPDGSRLIFTVRRWRRDDPQAVVWNTLHHGVLRYDVLTCRPDGSDVHDAVPAICWQHGGHHINWLPDSSGLSMNLGGFGDGLRFVRCAIDGSGLRPLLLDVRGSGHPTVHACGGILTDAYTGERPFAHDDGTTPLRWIDLASGHERDLIRMTTAVAAGRHVALRVDPHPAWDASRRLVAFNLVQDGVRRVALADCSALVSAGGCLWLSRISIRRWDT
jgi:WD40 repeat protein